MTPLVPLLEQLAVDGRTGVLRIDASGEVWLADGAVYLASTQDSADVASVLFGGGVASLDEIEQMLSAEGSDVAGELAGRQAGAGSVIGRLLHEHNLTGLFELMVPNTGTYEFNEGARHPLGPTFAEPLGDLVVQAERRLDIWRQIAARIPSVAVSFRLSRSLPEDAEERVVTADEWRYLSLLDSHRSVADVITETGESAFRVCTSLYRLLLEGLIEEVS